MEVNRFIRTPGEAGDHGTAPLRIPIYHRAGKLYARIDTELVERSSERVWRSCEGKTPAYRLRHGSYTVLICMDIYSRRFFLLLRRRFHREVLLAASAFGSTG
jgi:hypothetical protein